MRINIDKPQSGRWCRLQCNAVVLENEQETAYDLIPYNTSSYYLLHAAEGLHRAGSLSTWVGK
jgi:hypothetical protein